MTSTSSPPTTHPYLRAATAGLHHHTRTLATSTPLDRHHLDTLHAHLTTLERLLDQVAEAVRPGQPAAGRSLATAHTRLWQATAAVHDAFHLLPAAPAQSRECHPEQLPEGPPLLTICQRHLTATHAVRRKTTPTDLHATACVR